jgi:hypothetical protein
VVIDELNITDITCTDDEGIDLLRTAGHLVEIFNYSRLRYFKSQGSSENGSEKSKCAEYKYA